MASCWKSLTRRKMPDETESKLARVLTLFDLTALGVGSTLGLGVYVLAGSVAYEQAGPAVAVSFAFAAVASAFAGLCYAEFAGRVPRAGSAYVYSYVTVGEFVAFTIGWNLILEYVIGTASVARGLSGYLDALINNTMATTLKDVMPINVAFLGEYPDFFASGMVILLGCLLAFGVKESSMLNNIFTCVNMVTVCIVLVAGAIKADPGNWALTDVPENAGVGGFMPYGWAGVMAGAAKCFYGFIGFDVVATTGEEAINPKKNIPLSIIISLIIIFLAYFGVSTVLTMMWPYYLQNPDAPFPHVFQEVGWIAIKWIVTIGAIFALTTSLLGAMFPLPRVLYAMGKDGILFKCFAKVNAYTKTPLLATIISGAFSGSTFPKAKPKQSLSTVIRLAILRYFLLPVYAKWWVRQTSHKVFGMLLFLYITQMISWAVYTFKILHRLDSDVEHIVSISELLIPMALSLILSFIHSQIVATSVGSSSVSTKQHSYSNTTGKPRERFKRRKKLVKMRSLESECPANRKLTRSRATTPQESTTSIHNKTTFVPLKDNKLFINPPKNNSLETLALLESKKSSSSDTNSPKLTPQPTDLTGCCSSRLMPIASSINECKKRNVNWDTPIHNFATEVQIENPLSVNISAQASTASNSSAESSPREQIEVNKEPIIQEHKEDLNKLENVPQDGNGVVTKRSVGEDDGFESLNGKSSSGEDSNIPAVIALNTQPPIEKNQLRLRLNENINRSREDNSIIEDVFNASTPVLPTFRRKYPLSSESDIDRSGKNAILLKSASNEIFSKKVAKTSKSSDTNQESDEEEIISSPASIGASNYTECTTSATEWLGVTTNSEECSYSSELENSDFKPLSEDEGYDMDFTPTFILNPDGNKGRISCTVWENRDIKKAQMSVLDISSCIIERVEAMPETCDYIYFGIFFSISLSMIPPFCRLCEKTIDSEDSEINYLDIPMLLWEKASFSFIAILHFAFGNSQWERALLLIGFMQRLLLTLIFFMLFAVAERTFKQRFLYAKLFSHLTSSRRARKSDLPHFRLNKVRNIKTWLSVRSYLKKRGPQRSVDVIVSAAFLLTLLLLAFLSVEWLKDSVRLHSHLNLEALTWSTFMGIFLLRFMTLGNKINRKYRSISVLITEQINLYLQIEQKPKKKDELMVSNSVLKLAADLLKELELPFKISGLSANPYLYTTIKVVILSALSGVLSEMLGFKLKLHKIKIK